MRVFNAFMLFKDSKINFVFNKFYFVLIVIATVSCNSNSNVKPSKYEVKQALERANKQIVKENSDMIEAYILRHKWKVQETGTGLRYYVYKSGDGQKIKSGDMVNIEYSLKTLDGIVIIEKEKAISKPFVVEKESAESGIHEVLKLLKVGDEVKVILPPHLAFGLTGSENVPPMATLVYDLKVR